MTQQEQTTERSTDKWCRLADLYRGILTEYFCSASSSELLRCNAEYMGATLGGLGLLHFDTLPSLMRVIAHYAATATESEKADTIATLTARNGAVAILNHIATNSDRFSIWGDVLGALADEVID